MFWNNPKASATPHLWQVVNGPSDVVFYLDPEQGRAATIDLETLQGNFIPATLRRRPASQEIRRSSSPKIRCLTQVESTDSTTVYTATIDSGSMRLTLRSEKDADQAKAVYSGCVATAGERRPAMQHGNSPSNLWNAPMAATAFTFTVTNWTALKEPLRVDASELSIKIQSGTSAP